MQMKLKRVGSGSNILGIFIAFVLLCVIMGFASPVFLKVDNFLNVFQQVSINFVVALGMSYVIISGGIDLSIGSNMAVVGLLMAMMMKAGVGVFPSILAGLLLSGIIGLLNGAMIAYLKLPPFITTLGMMYIARGFAYTITGGQPVYTLPASFTAISNRVMGVPLYTIIIMVVLLILCWYNLKYMRIGRNVFAIGGNEACAKLSGINTERLTFYTFVNMGVLAALAGMIIAARLNSATPKAGVGFELDVIAACFIGGASASGGVGKIIGAVIGAFIMGVMNNGMSIMGIGIDYQQLIKGLVLLAAVFFDVYNKNKAV